MTRLPSYSFALLFLVLSLTGCGALPTAKVPMDTLSFQPTKQQRTLIVFLPGVTDKPVAFEKNNFVAAVRERGLPIDMMAAHAHLGYLRNQAFVHRLKEDVIEPAKKKGYKRIWFVGNSLGSLFALLYIKKYPKDIDGVFLLAPFLGKTGPLEDIHKAGGLRAWRPEHFSGHERQRELWTWLKHYPHDNSSYPKMYLGFGDQDRLALGHRLLADSLPSGRVFTMPGKHRWTVWIVLWRKFLDKKIIG